MIKIAAIELEKYVRAFVIIIICYGLFTAILESRFDAKNFFQYGTFDLETFKVVNSSFTSFIRSLIPFTIILNICNEFKNGYALKLISNGLTRHSYYSSKLILAAALAVISMLMYALIVSFLLTIQKTSYFDTSHFIISLVYVLIFSMFFSSMAVSLALLLRTWQYTVLAYYVYGTAELVVVLRFQETASWVKYLPFNLAASIFGLQAVPENFSDYLLAAGIIIPFCLGIIWSAYHFFKKADL